MRTRIKVIELNSGRKIYIPQTQGVGKFPKRIWRLIYKYAPNFFWMGYEEFDNIEDAKSELDKTLEHEKKIVAQRVKEVKYLKYPL